MKATFFSLVVAFGLFLVPGAAHGQEADRFGEPDVNGTSFKRFAYPGEATIQIYLLGAVSGPGIYEIGRGTDLVELMALTGTAFPVRVSFERVKASIKIYRMVGEGREQIYDKSLKDAFVNPAEAPVLQDGDVIHVDMVRKGLGTITVLRTVTTLLTLVILVDRLVTN